MTKVAKTERFNEKTKQFKQKIRPFTIDLFTICQVEWTNSKKVMKYLTQIKVEYFQVAYGVKVKNIIEM